MTIYTRFLREVARMWNSPAVHIGQMSNCGERARIATLCVHFLTCFVSLWLVNRLFYDAVSTVEDM
jgi:hypothetical protein